MRIKGITVILYKKTEIGRDAFDNPVYKEEPLEVKDVLVSPSSSTDIAEQLNLYGKKAVYTLDIPKGDSNDWIDSKVEFFGSTWTTFGFPVEGLDELIPLKWNKKVMVEKYG